MIARKRRPAWLFAVAAVAGLVAGPSGGNAAELEQKHVVIAVGGVTSQVDKLAYAVALHRGYFADEGLEVESIDFGSGSKGLQAMVGGSADVTQGAYEHTIRLQARGEELTAFVIFARYPGNVLAIVASQADKIKSAEDLRGKRIAISAPGSGTHNFVAKYLARHGLDVGIASYIGVGNGPGAIAAVRAGDQIDAIVNLDPVMSELEANNDVVVLADSRTREGTHEVYGGDYVSSSLYARRSWVLEHPNTVQAMTNAIVRAMQWLKSASIDDIVATMPEKYYSHNREVYEASLRNNLQAFAWDGIVSAEIPENVRKTIQDFDKDLDLSKVDLSTTYTNEYTENALKKYGG